MDYVDDFLESNTLGMFDINAESPELFYSEPTISIKEEKDLYSEPANNDHKEENDNNIKEEKDFAKSYENAKAGSNADRKTGKKA